MAQTFWPLDKSAVVIQPGLAYTKVGYATEPVPRFCLRTPELRSVQHTAVGESSLSVEEWRRPLERLLMRIFFVLQAGPSDRRVVIVENLLFPVPLRECLVELLFDRFDVPAVHFLPEMVAPFYTVGHGTGLVVDVGYSETRVLPACFGCPVYTAYRRVAIGGKHVGDAAKKVLLGAVEEGRFRWRGRAKVEGDGMSRALHTVQMMPETSVDDVKCGALYCKYEAGDVKLEASKGWKVELEGDLFVHLLPEERHEPCEVLFGETTAKGGREIINPLEAASVVEAVIASLEASNREVRRYAVENVLVCGGTGELRGFHTRFALELKKAIENHSELRTLLPFVAFGTPSFASSIRQWTGAAVYSAIEGLEMYTSQRWKMQERLPDWLSPPPEFFTSYQNDEFDEEEEDEEGEGGGEGTDEDHGSMETPVDVGLMVSA